MAFIARYVRSWSASAVVSASSVAEASERAKELWTRQREQSALLQAEVPQDLRELQVEILTDAELDIVNQSSDSLDVVEGMFAARVASALRGAQTGEVLYQASFEFSLSVERELSSSTAEAAEDEAEELVSDVNDDLGAWIDGQLESALSDGRIGFDFEHLPWEDHTEVCEAEQ